MNLLFQMFFGMPARIVNSQGRAVQGILGFTGALIKPASAETIKAMLDSITAKPGA